MTISRSKKVSVVVPNYNYGKYIKKRIRSILKQTYPIYELIVLDDASTDGSAEMLKSVVLDLKLKNPEMRVRFVGVKIIQVRRWRNGRKGLNWRKGILCG